jgi:DNA polymerase I-like protein with 3'-5' exonuclease and polymerase domains
MGAQDYQLVDTQVKLNSLIKKLSDAKEVVVDTETTSLNVLDAKLLGISLSYKEGEAYYVPENNISEDLVKLLADKSIKKMHGFN